MKTKKSRFPALSLAVVAMLAILNAPTSTAHAQGTAFTYQGRLNAGGSPVSGNYDFRFKLYTDSYGNNQVGNTQLTNALPVSAGLFITTIDFGPGLLTGASHWLEVDVRTNGAGDYTVLSPLQALTPAPYAVFANTASNVSGTVSAAQISGTVASANLSGTYGNALTLNNAGNSFSGTLNGNAATATTANSFSGSLAGDVTGSQSATTVTSVGGQAAANIAAGANAANAATSADEAYTIVKRDASGNVTDNSLTLNGSLNLPATTASTGIIYAGGNPLVHAYGNGNFFAGSSAGNLTMSGGHNTGVGYLALDSDTSGYQNAALGWEALYNNLDGCFNTASGYSALLDNTGGSFNTANGYSVLFKNTSGNGNTANGYSAAYDNTNGNYNTASGYYALYSNASGSNNIALGYLAGFLITGSSNIDIGNQGLPADNSIIRIGTSQTATYLAGNVYANGVLLTSDRNAKENFTAVNAREVLARVAALPVTEWNYRTDNKAVQHIGPMAQDFQAAFGLAGTDDKHISVVDEGGVALAAIQGLNQKVEEKDAEIQALKQNVAELKALIQKLAGK